MLFRCLSAFLWLLHVYTYTCAKSVLFCYVFYIFYDKFDCCNGIFEWMHNAWSFIRDRLRAADIRTARTKRNKEMKIVNILLQRLSENSTWRGLILIATAVGVKIEPELQEAILVAGLGLVGLINVIRKG